MNPIIIFVRILLAPLILKWPLFGGFIAVFLDNIDWYVREIFGVSAIGDYQSIDKFLDTFYLSFLLIVALSFNNKLIRNILIFLFIYRLVGWGFFEITGMRFLLLIFPNVFENFFFFYYIVCRIAKYEPRIHYPFLGIFLIVITLQKMLQEYSIHIAEESLPAEPQIIFILGISIMSGLWYRKFKKVNSNISR